MLQRIHPRPILRALGRRSKPMPTPLQQMQLHHRPRLIHLQKQLRRRVRRPPVMRRRQQKHRRKLRQLLPRPRPPRAVNHDQRMRLRREPFHRIRRLRVSRRRRRSHDPRHTRPRAKPRKRDPLRINPKLLRPALHQSNRPVTIRRPRRVVVARVQPIRQHKRRRPPVIELLGDINPFEVVHQHDVRSPRRNHHRRPVRFPGRLKHRQKRGVQRTIAHRLRHLARLPQRYVVVRLTRIQHRQTSCHQNQISEEHR